MKCPIFRCSISTVNCTLLFKHRGESQPRIMKLILFFRTQSGLHVTVGDDMGRIWVYDVGEALAIPGQVTIYIFHFPGLATF